MKRGRPAKYGRKIKRDPDEALTRCAANAAESMRRITLTLQQANAAGLSYGQFVAETERSRAMKPLSQEIREKIEQLHAEGKTREEIANETGVSKTSVQRIVTGERGSAVEPQKPGPKPKPDILRLLITQALEMLERSEVDCKEIGAAVGLLTAAEMMLGERE